QSWAVSSPAIALTPLPESRRCGYHRGMASEPYLIRLATRLSSGLERLEPQRRARHRAFILSRQQSDGGFMGREGDSDLYYTSFAVRSLVLLGGLTPTECDTIGRFVRANVDRRM